MLRLGRWKALKFKPTQIRFVIEGDEESLVEKAIFTNVVTYLNLSVKHLEALIAARADPKYALLEDEPVFLGAAKRIKTAGGHNFTLSPNASELLRTTLVDSNAGDLN